MSQPYGAPNDFGAAPSMLPPGAAPAAVPAQPQDGTAYPQAYGAPTSGQAYGAPAAGQAYGAPAAGQAYGAPAYGAPAYGQAPGAPAYGQSPGAPAYGQHPGAPAYGQAPGGPAYAQASAEAGAHPYQQQGSVTACRMCGSVPAAATTFRGHRGFIVVMQFLSAEGPFCRDCGLATFRSMTSRTLVQGWYGYASLIITPITVLINLFRRGKVAKLATPQPNPYGPSRPPMDPGARLLMRPMTIIGLAIPFALLILLIIAIGSSS